MKDMNAILLAGGKSSRMGQDKGLMQIGGKTMVEFLLDELERVGIEEVNIIANNTDYQKLDRPVYSDLIKEKGPLGGLYTGLYHSTAEWSIFLPCDTPNIKAKYLKLLIEEKEQNPIQVVKSRYKTHFLIGIVHHSVRDLIKVQIDSGDLRVETWIKNLGGRIIELENHFDFEEADFINVNTKEEFNKIKSYENV